MWLRICKGQTKLSLKNHYQVCKVISEGQLEKNAEPSQPGLGHNTCSGLSLCCPLLPTSVVANCWVWSCIHLANNRL